MLAAEVLLLQSALSTNCEFTFANTYCCYSRIFLGFANASLECANYEHVRGFNANYEYDFTRKNKRSCKRAWSMNSTSYIANSEFQDFRFSFYSNACIDNLCLNYKSNSYLDGVSVRVVNSFLY